MTLTMNIHAAFVNVQQMKYVIGSGKLYIRNNMQKSVHLIGQLTFPIFELFSLYLDNGITISNDGTILEVKLFPAGLILKNQKNKNRCCTYKIVETWESQID
jgi:hypothetical protein